MEKATKIDECKFRLLGGAMLYDNETLDKSYQASNYNLTNELALQHLNKYPARKELFQVLPENLEELLKEYNGEEETVEKPKETIKTNSIAKQTRAIVTRCFANTRTESEFRADLREKGIYLVLRHNNGGRIHGATFIDHNQRVVLNGSRLGKEFSANVLNERFADNSPSENIQVSPRNSENPYQKEQPTTEKQSRAQSGHSTVDDAVGSLFSVFTPEVDGTENKQSSLKRKRKKKRRYGRQM